MARGESCRSECRWSRARLVTRGAVHRIQASDPKGPVHPTGGGVELGGGRRERSLPLSDGSLRRPRTGRVGERGGAESPPAAGRGGREPPPGRELPGGGGGSHAVVDGWLCISGVDEDRRGGCLSASTSPSRRRLRVVDIPGAPLSGQRPLSPSPIGESAGRQCCRPSLGRRPHWRPTQWARPGQVEGGWAPLARAPQKWLGDLDAVGQVVRVVSVRTRPGPRGRVPRRRQSVGEWALARLVPSGRSDIGRRTGGREPWPDHCLLGCLHRVSPSACVVGLDPGRDCRRREVAPAPGQTGASPKRRREGIAPGPSTSMAHVAQRAPESPPRSPARGAPPRRGAVSPWRRGARVDPHLWRIHSRECRSVQSPSLGRAIRAVWQAG